MGEIVIVRKRNAQVSMEYLVIVGFVVVVIIPMTILFYSYADSTEDEVVSNQVQKIGLKISDSAEAMYYLGAPSKTRVKAFFPKKISNISISNNEIVFNVTTKQGLDQVVIYVPIPVQGSLDSHMGYHTIEIESKGDYVEISD